jgi:hypothetical protein
MIDCNQVGAQQEFSLRTCPHKAEANDKQRVVGALFDRVREDNMTLQDAIARNDSDHVIAILENGTDLSILDEDGKTALMIACDKGHSSFVSLLIQYGALTTAAIRSKKNATALDYAMKHAIQGQSTHVVKLLIRKGIGCYQNLGDRLPEIWQVAASRIEILAVLLDPVSLREAVLQVNWSQIKDSSSTFMQRKFRGCLGKQDTASVNALSVHGHLIKRPVTIVTDFCATGVLSNNGRVLKLRNINPEALCESVGQSQKRCYQLAIYLSSEHGFLEIANESQRLVRGFYPTHFPTLKLHPFQTMPQSYCKVIDDRDYKLTAILGKPKLTFYLPQDQGQAAWEYINALTNMCGEDTQQTQCRFDHSYGNCENFVQNVSEIAGINGRFTDYFLKERWDPAKATLYMPVFNSYVLTYNAIIATVLTLIGMRLINRIGLYFAPLRRVE